MAMRILKTEKKDLIDKKKEGEMQYRRGGG
jgi:hypothetical protein